MTLSGNKILKLVFTRLTFFLPVRSPPAGMLRVWYKRSTRKLSQHGPALSCPSLLEAADVIKHAGAPQREGGAGRPEEAARKQPRLYDPQRGSLSAPAVRPQGATCLPEPGRVAETAFSAAPRREQLDAARVSQREGLAGLNHLGAPLKTGQPLSAPEAKLSGGE